MVQVSEDPSAVVAEIPVPEQRLATNTTNKRGTKQPSAATDPKTAVAAKVGMPEIFQDKSATRTTLPATQPPVANRVAEAPSNVTVSMSDSPDGSDVKLAGNTEPSNDQVHVSVGGLVSASLSDLSAAESPVKAVQNDAVQQHALTDSPPAAASTANTPAPSKPQTESERSETKPVVASIASTPTTATPQQVTSPAGTTASASTSAPASASIGATANTTDKPNALTEALQQSLARLPELPESENTDRAPGAPVPTRIGAASAQIAHSAGAQSAGTPSASETAVAQSAATQKTAASGKPESGPTPELASATPATATQPSADSQNANTGSEPILPASHASTDTVFGTASYKTPSSDDPPTATASDELTEDELYKRLLAQLLEQRADESPAERERRLITAKHLLVLSGQLDKALEAIEGLNETEQAALGSQLQGLWTLIDPDGHPSSGRRITEALPKFREATARLAAVTDSLTLRSLEFCTEIESFGQIKPFAGNRFSAGQQVILYCEVENFAAASDGDIFMTQLKGTYDIYDRSGTKIVSQLLPADQQRSRNRLRDYFVAYQMNLPKGLTSGSYRLQLTIEDAIGKKYGQAEIPFEIE